MSEINIDENNKEKLLKLFSNFLDSHDWSEDTKMACSYSFFHTINLINGNLRKVSESDSLVTDKQSYVCDNDYFVLRNNIIDQAIETIKSCELVAPNVRRIRVDQAVGALIELKSSPQRKI
jgi:hypothetical protein